MSDDLLGRAVQALRETSSEPNPRSGLTRARLLDSAEKRQAARGRRGVRIVFGVLGLFVAGNALARVAEYFPEVLTVFAPPPATAPAPQPKPAPKPRPKPALAPATAAPEVVPAPVPATVPAPEPAPPSVARTAEPSVARAAEPIPERPRPRPATKPLHAPQPPAEVEAPATPAPRVESAELALFRRAQSLHLAHADGALAAWDAYLRVAGNGVLVPEARYNRALCLVRLGRKRDARAALEPFARGDFGEYRRREAQALLEALR